MPIYLIRHGQTKWNEEGRVQGKEDSDLTELGIKQARDVAITMEKILGNENKKITFYSPLPRAAVTAGIVIGKIGGECRKVKELEERGYGKWEGKTEEELKGMGEEWEKYKSSEEKLHQNVAGIEKYSSLILRLQSFVKSLRDEYDVFNDDIVIIAHQTVNRFLLPLLLEEKELSVEEVYPLGTKYQKNDEILKIESTLETVEENYVVEGVEK